MEQKYNIKGIEKIINTAGKERLAEYYNVKTNADFENIITNDFRRHNIPDGLEVAFYLSLLPEEHNKVMKEKGSIEALEAYKQRIAVEFYEQDEKGRAIFGIPYMRNIAQYDRNDPKKMISGTWGNILYFLVDEPIIMEEVGDSKYFPMYGTGGVYYNELLMGRKYYATHRTELEEAYPDGSKIKAVDKYIDNFIQEYKNLPPLGKMRFWTWI